MQARDESIDLFRGLAVALMVPANYLEHVAVVPPWLKHAPDVGLTMVDFVAPFFVFAIGLTLPGSLRRRHASEGTRRATEHLLRRCLALIGLGALFSLGETSYGFNPGGLQWGTLQAIGAASLLASPLVLLAPGPRFASAIALLGAYQFGLGHGWLARVLASPQAGLPGVLAWSALLAMATVAGELLPTRPRLLGTLGLGALAAGAASAFVTPLSKHRMSTPFVLVAFGAALLVFLAVRALNRRGWRAEGLRAWGGNPLVLYCAHLVLLGAFLVPEARWWHIDASLPQAAVQFVVYAGVLHGLAVSLWRRGMVITL